MAKPFRGPELIKEIDKALDKGLARLLILTQGKLAAANPADTGRMASSWFIGKGVPDRTTRPDNWAEPGAQRVEASPYEGPITMKDDWYISNSLPYAERVSFNPLWSKNGRRGGSAWFTQIQNGLPKDAERAFEFFLRKVK